MTIRADATYLVTGGLSGLGLRTAQWLVQRGARHLALLSRRGAAATPEAAAALAEFEAAGVSVLAPPCDVADPAMLRAVLADIDSMMPPLRGVVHAAMVIEDALLRDLTRGQLQRVLAPKVLGAMHLHEATRSRPLDFFVLHSSATTLFGNPGQAAYVAANMGLEALANERRSLGLQVTCVGWGPIADSGYLSRNEHTLKALVGRMGGQALQTGVLLAALEHLLTCPSGNLAFLDLDWQALAKSLPGARAAKFSDLARLAGGAERGHAGESAQELRRWLGSLSAAERLAELTTLVRAETGSILRIAPERLEPAASLLDMGMDSLMAVELAASIEARLDVRLSALAVSTNPSIDSIVERIARLLERGETGAPESAGAALASQVYSVASQHADQLSADEAARMVDALSADDATAPSLTRAAGA